jgi:hypothetical protein
MRRRQASGPADDALTRIEAALQAGLGGSGEARPDLARAALGGADAQLEAWLEAVAAELNRGGALVPEDMVEAIAGRMLANPGQSLGAHRRIEGRSLEELVPRP